MTTKARIAALQWFHDRGEVSSIREAPFGSEMLFRMQREGQVQWRNTGNQIWSITDKGRQDLHEATKMTDTEALDKLIAAVEAGSIPLSDLDAFIPSLGLNTHGNDAHIAYRGSLDAAKALHEVLVPDYNFETFSLHGEVVIKRIKPIDRHYGWADLDPARAWLIAILKAYRAQVTE